MDGENYKADDVLDYNPAVLEDALGADIRELLAYLVVQSEKTGRPVAIHAYTNHAHFRETIRSLLQPSVPARLTNAMDHLIDRLEEVADQSFFGERPTSIHRIVLNIARHPIVDRLVPNTPAAYAMGDITHGVIRHRAALAKDIWGLDPELHDVPPGFVFINQLAFVDPTDRQEGVNKPGGNLWMFTDKELDEMAKLRAEQMRRLMPYGDFNIRAPHPHVSADEAEEGEKAAEETAEEKGEETGETAGEEIAEMAGGALAAAEIAKVFEEHRRQNEELFKRTREQDERFRETQKRSAEVTEQMRAGGERYRKQQETIAAAIEGQHRSDEQFHQQQEQQAQRRESKEAMARRAEEMEINNGLAEAIARLEATFGRIYDRELEISHHLHLSPEVFVLGGEIGILRGILARGLGNEALRARASADVLRGMELGFEFRRLRREERAYEAGEVREERVVRAERLERMEGASEAAVVARGLGAGELTGGERAEGEALGTADTGELEASPEGARSRLAAEAMTDRAIGSAEAIDERARVAAEQAALRAERAARAGEGAQPGVAEAGLAGATDRAAAGTAEQRETAPAGTIGEEGVAVVTAESAETPAAGAPAAEAREGTQPTDTENGAPIMQEVIVENLIEEAKNEVAEPLQNLQMAPEQTAGETREETVPVAPAVEGAAATGTEEVERGSVAAGTAPEPREGTQPTDTENGAPVLQEAVTEGIIENAKDEIAEPMQTLQMAPERNAGEEREGTLPGAAATQGAAATGGSEDEAGAVAAGTAVGTEPTEARDVTEIPAGAAPATGEPEPGTEPQPTDQQTESPIVKDVIRDEIIENAKDEVAQPVQELQMTPSENEREQHAVTETQPAAAAAATGEPEESETPAAAAGPESEQVLEAADMARRPTDPAAPEVSSQPTRPTEQAAQTDSGAPPPKEVLDKAAEDAVRQDQAAEEASKTLDERAQMDQALVEDSLPDQQYQPPAPTNQSHTAPPPGQNKATEQPVAEQQPEQPPIAEDQIQQADQPPTDQNADQPAAQGQPPQDRVERQEQAQPSESSGEGLGEKVRHHATLEAAAAVFAIPPEPSAASHTATASTAAAPPPASQQPEAQPPASTPSAVTPVVSAPAAQAPKQPPAAAAPPPPAQKQPRTRAARQQAAPPATQQRQAAQQPAARRKAAPRAPAKASPGAGRVVPVRKIKVKPFEPVKKPAIQSRPVAIPKHKKVDAAAAPRRANPPPAPQTHSTPPKPRATTPRANGSGGKPPSRKTPVPGPMGVKRHHYEVLPKPRRLGQPDITKPEPQ